jgi:hypothetical protein
MIRGLETELIGALAGPLARHKFKEAKPGIKTRGEKNIIDSLDNALSEGMWSVREYVDNLKSKYLGKKRRQLSPLYCRARKCSTGPMLSDRDLGGTSSGWQS